MAPSGEEIRAITEIARDLAFRQLDQQLSASDNLETEGLGLPSMAGQERRPDAVDAVIGVQKSEVEVVTARACASTEKSVQMAS
jgi:hypothetical protein